MNIEQARNLFRDADDYYSDRVMKMPEALRAAVMNRNGIVTSGAAMEMCAEIFHTIAVDFYRHMESWS